MLLLGADKDFFRYQEAKEVTRRYKNVNKNQCGGI